MKSDQLSEKSFWDQEWRDGKEDYGVFVSGEVIRKFIPRAGGSFFEVGCAPGGIMCWFHKEMGYQVNGIDYSSIGIIEDYLRSNGIQHFTLFDGDFTKAEIKEKYDVVASFGFIEHFVDYNAIIQKHKSLVKDKGYLILQLPNLRYFNWLIYRIFNPGLLAIHNLEVMNVRKLREAVGEGYTFLYSGYHKTSFLSFQEDNSELDKRPVLRKVFVALKKTMELLKLDNIPNRFFSPYIIVIANKK